MSIQTQDYDIIIIGGGTAGPMAAIKAKEQDKSLRVLLLDKANVKRSGAISMGMDGLNNAIIPGHATPSSTPRKSPWPMTASSTRPPCMPTQPTALKPSSNSTAGA